MATDPDHGDGERVDGDLEGEHDCVLGGEADKRRRPTGQTERFPALFDDQAGGDEVTDEPADAAARQAGALAEPLRDSGPSACSARTSALRLARRTLSLRCPLSPPCPPPTPP